MRYAYPFARIGQADLVLPTKEEPEAPPETLGAALAKITPTLLIVGIATGAAFAIGSGLINRYFFRGRS